MGWSINIVTLLSFADQRPSNNRTLTIFSIVGYEKWQVKVLGDKITKANNKSNNTNLNSSFFLGFGSAEGVFYM